MPKRTERNAPTNNRGSDLRRLAVGYARVSTTAQGEKGTSLEVQRKVIEAFADAADWTLVEVIQEMASGVGARSFNARQGLQAALNLVVRDEAVLIVSDWDRLSRYAGFERQVRKRLPDLGRIICAKEGNTMREAARDSRFAHHAMSAAIISSRTREGMDKKRAEGAIFGNPEIRSVAPLGWSAWSTLCRDRYHDIADVLRDHPDAMTLFKAQVVEILNQSGLRTAKNNEWTKSRVTEPLKRARAILREEERTRMASDPRFGMF